VERAGANESAASAARVELPEPETIRLTKETLCYFCPAGKSRLLTVVTPLPIAWLFPSKTWLFFLGDTANRQSVTQVYIEASTKMSEKADPSEEQREHPRKPSPLRHRIAAYRREVRPEKLSFRWIRCCDTSPSGFSFWSKSPPAGNELVLDLTGRDNAGFMLAQVKNVRQAGEGRYLIGCQIVRRLN
jgi:hypothetical protein